MKEQKHVDQVALQIQDLLAAIAQQRRLLIEMHDTLEKLEVDLAVARHNNDHLTAEDIHFGPEVLSGS
jgi:hypothetical protein